MGGQLVGDKSCQAEEEAGRLGNQQVPYPSRGPSLPCLSVCHKSDWFTELYHMCV